MKKNTYHKPAAARIDLQAAESTLLVLSVKEPGTGEEVGGSDALGNKKGWSSEGWSNGDAYWTEGSDDSED